MDEKTDSAAQGPPVETPTAVMPQVTVGEAITKGWELIKANPGVLILGVLVYFLVSWIPLINFIFTGGLYMLALKAYRGQETSVGEIFGHFDKFVALLVGGLLVFLAVLVGTALFVIPGILLALVFSQVFFLITDKGMDGVEAMKESVRITQGYRLTIFLFLLVMVVVSSLVALIPVVGAIIAMLLIFPIILGGQAYIYESIKDR